VLLGLSVREQLEDVFRADGKRYYSIFEAHRQTFALFGLGDGTAIFSDSHKSFVSTFGLTEAETYIMTKILHLPRKEGEDYSGIDFFNGVVPAGV